MIKADLVEKVTLLGDLTPSDRFAKPAIERGAYVLLHSRSPFIRLPAF